MRIIAPALGLPAGTTAQRPSSPEPGFVRFNTTLEVFEGWDGSDWSPLGAADTSDYLNRITGGTVEGVVTMLTVLVVGNSADTTWAPIVMRRQSAEGKPAEMLLGLDHIGRAVLERAYDGSPAGRLVMNEGQLIFEETIGDPVHDLLDKYTKAEVDGMFTSGTWTPVITGSVANATITYAAQVGRWFRIGYMVFAQVALQTSTRSGGSGVARISLPFVAAGGSNFPHPCFTSNIPFPSGRTSMHALPQDGGDYFTVTGSGSSISGAALAIADIPASSAALIRATLVYETSDP